MSYPENSVIRINTAWINSIDELEKILDSLKGHRIWLDYPTGRTKPPLPKFKMEEIIQFAKTHLIEYFAFSNAEDSEFIKSIRESIPELVKLVPKIETKRGVENIKDILDSAKTDMIMLDKEDLYLDVSGNQEEFQNLISICREKCEEFNVTCLELKGVVFGHN